MRVLLISPPFYRLMGSHYNGLALGLSYVGASLRQQGHEVMLYNADYLAQDWYPDQKQIFDGFTDYKKAHIDHPVWSEVEQAIREARPDVVGITMYTAAWKSAQRVARIAKSVDSNIQVIVGGAHPTLSLRDTLELPYIDNVVKGEGEHITLEDMKDWEITKRPDINGLSFPMRDSFINDTAYMDLGNIITGRGCPNKCTYCASPAIWRGEYRLRDVENVVDELKEMKGLGVETIRFCDDTFNLNTDHTIALLQHMMEEKIYLPWVADMRVDRLSEGLLDLMALSDCQRIKIGVESGSDRVLKSIKKGLTVEKIKQGVELIQQSGIPFTAYLMCGFPDETDEDIEHTLELANWMDANYYSVSIFTPYYGTAIWNELEYQGKLPHDRHWEYFYHQSQVMIANDGLSREKVQELLALNDKGRSRL